MNKINYFQTLCTWFKSFHAALAYTAIMFASLWPTTAHAYIDPGSGSVVISTLIGIAAATAYTFKKYFYKLKRLFRKDTSLEDDNPLDRVDKK